MTIRAGFCVSAALCLVAVLLATVAMPLSAWYRYRYQTSYPWSGGETVWDIEFGLYDLSVCESGIIPLCEVVYYSDIINELKSEPSSFRSYERDYERIHIAGALVTTAGVMNVLLCFPVLGLLLAVSFGDLITSHYPHVFTATIQRLIPYTPLAIILCDLCMVFWWTALFPYKDFKTFAGPSSTGTSSVHIGSGLIVMIISFIVAVGAYVASVVTWRRLVKTGAVILHAPLITNAAGRVEPSTPPSDSMFELEETDSPAQTDAP